MVNALKRFKNSPIWTPLILLVVCVLAYGLLIPSLGFYWDDLPYALIYQRFGPGGYPAFVESDRPHSAWIFMSLTWLLGEQPLGYHIFGLGLYWVCVLLFWGFLRSLWPQHTKEALWAALLFAIYPGFLGQPKTIIYNHHFTAMALYLFSLIGTVKAVQNPKTEGRWQSAWLWHVPAVLATAFSQFTIEYYLGWEAVRIVTVWILLKRRTSNHKPRLREGLLNLAPYWLVTIGFLVWRVLIFRFPTYQPLGGEGANLASLGWWRDIVFQVVDAVILVWGHVLPQFSDQSFGQPFWLAYLFLTLFSTLLIFVVLYFPHARKKNSLQNEATEPRKDFGGPALLLAVVGIAFAGWPFWLVDLQLSIVGHFYSRFTLAFIPWVALLITVLLHYVSSARFPWTKVVTSGVVALLVGGSIGWHFWNANYYRNQWREVQYYFHQLVHRAPGLEEGTVLLINDLSSLSLYQDDSLTALLNWTYAPDNKTETLDYAVFYLSVRLGLEFPALEPGYAIDKDYRSLHFSSSTDNFLVVDYEPPGCLRVLNPSQPDRVPLTLSEAMRAAVPLSNLDLIITGQVPRATPPVHLFELPETDSWCLLYQDAELAAQQGEWARVAEIGDQAYAGEDQANELTEHFVFIDGYLRAGEEETAFDLSKALSERTGGELDGRICGIWRGAASETELGAYYEQICPAQPGGE
jgi:hypothetical protein